MAELAERIEVLKGPSVLLSGMPPFGSIGGTINIVPKRAPDEGLTQVTASYASTGQVGGHADVARRFGEDKQFGVRVNGVFKAGQTAVENNTDQRALGVVGLDFRGDHVRLAADMGYQYRYVGGMMSYLGLNPGVPLPWAPDARKNQGQPWSFVERKDLFGVVRAEVDLTDSITAYAALGAHDSRQEGLFSATVTSTNFLGAATAGAPQNSTSYSQYLTADAGVRALFRTGPIGHEVAVTGTTYENVEGFGDVFGTAFASNIYNPTIIVRPNIATPAANKASTRSLSSLGIADTLSAADKRIQLTAGLRLQNVASQNYNTMTGQATSGYNQSVVSPAVALVFKPWDNVSVYGNFIQGLQQGQVVGAQFANAGEVFPPFVSTQYEAGVKVDWGKFTTTASLFQITQPFTITNVTANTLILGGQQTNQGLELNVFGEPLQGVRLLGGAMFMNPVLTQTQGGTTNGWIAPFSPQVSLNLSGEWDLPFVPGLTFSGRVIYTGSQYVDTTFPRRSLPEWTRFDLGARYAFENPGAKGKLLVARFNVENVFDADYWQGGNVATQLFLGAPRTFRLSLTADF
jgi:iron complex outermembrane receptor protein